MRKHVTYAIDTKPDIPKKLHERSSSPFTRTSAPSNPNKPRTVITKSNETPYSRDNDEPFNVPSYHPTEPSNNTTLPAQVRPNNQLRITEDSTLESETIVSKLTESNIDELIIDEFKDTDEKQRPVKPKTNQPITKRDRSPEQKSLKAEPTRSQPFSTEPESFEQRPFRESTPSVSEPIQPARYTSQKPDRKPLTEAERVDELFTTTQTTKLIKNRNNINEIFLTEERSPIPQSLDDEEAPDGSFFSKQYEPEPDSEPEFTTNSPTFRKKGLSRRETFEERCRVILGMENEGDTQGVYKPKSETEVEPTELFEPRAKSPEKSQPQRNLPANYEPQQSVEPTSEQPKSPKPNTFEVRVEDCDDDEPLSINNVRKSLKVREDTIVTTEETTTTDNKRKSNKNETEPKQKSYPTTQKEPTYSTGKPKDQSAPITKRQKNPSPVRDTTTQQMASSPLPESTSPTTKRNPITNTNGNEPEKLWKVSTKPATTRKTITQTTEDFITLEKSYKEATDDEESNATIIVQTVESTKPAQFVEDIDKVIIETKRTKAPKSTPKALVEDYEDNVAKQTYSIEKIITTDEKKKTTQRDRTTNINGNQPEQLWQVPTKPGTTRTTPTRTTEKESYTETTDDETIETMREPTIEPKKPKPSSKTKEFVEEIETTLDETKRNKAHNTTPKTFIEEYDDDVQTYRTEKIITTDQKNKITQRSRTTNTNGNNPEELEEVPTEDNTCTETTDDEEPEQFVEEIETITTKTTRTKGPKSPKPTSTSYIDDYEDDEETQIYKNEKAITTDEKKKTTQRGRITNTNGNEPAELWQVPNKPETPRKTVTRTTDNFITQEKLYKETTDDEESIEVIEQQNIQPREPEQFIEEIETTITETERTKAPKTTPKPFVEDYEDDVEKQTYRTTKIITTDEKKKTTQRGRTTNTIENKPAELGHVPTKPGTTRKTPTYTTENFIPEDKSYTETTDDEESIETIKEQSIEPKETEPFVEEIETIITETKITKSPKSSKPTTKTFIEEYNDDVENQIYKKVITTDEKKKTTQRGRTTYTNDNEPEKLWQLPKKPETTRKTITQTTENFITQEKLYKETTDDEESIEVIEQQNIEPREPEQFIEDIETTITETKHTKAPKLMPKPQPEDIIYVEEYKDNNIQQTYRTEKVITSDEKMTTTQRGRNTSPSSKETSPERPNKRLNQVDKTVSTPKTTSTKNTPERFTNGKGPKEPQENKKPARKQVEPVKENYTPTKKRPSITKATPQEPIQDLQKSTVSSTTSITKKSTTTNISDGLTRRTVKDQSPNIPKKKPTTTITNDNDSPSTTRQSRKPSSDVPTSTIKDRLRSSPRKTKTKPDDIDGHTTTSTSTESSPTRYDTERRRSSNISVHTEIIIDHVAPKSPKPSPKASPEKELPSDYPIDTKPIRQRLPVTERKESAPVQRVTRREKEMTRSTSENVMKVTKKLELEKQTLRPTTPTTPTTPTKQDKRPNKCFTTKTINLSTKEQGMENVIIDIQHAKSSREPSPDKIIPTPVPAHLDTGKPRYPDVVQEPEDEPFKPVIKNIPIFEEDTNEYTKCHITEINLNAKRDLHELRDAEEILINPTIEAPISLEFDRPDDECLLTVPEKVAKFAHTAEEVSKPKASSPFNREIGDTTKVPENDECLLTINQKVDKFLKDAESITKHKVTITRSIERPNYDDLDEDLREDECTLSVSQKVNKFIDTAEKLAPTAPQKSPRLVASIERNISRQDERDITEKPTGPAPKQPAKPDREQPEEPKQPKYTDEFDEPEEPLEPFSKNHTIEIEKKRQKEILSRNMVWVENKEETELLDDKNYTDDDDEELVPMSKTHTTTIEMKRQKNILSRPSVFDKSPRPAKPQDEVKPKPTRITPTETKTTPRVPQPQSMPKDRPTDFKVVTKLNTNKVSSTRSRFEQPKSPDRRPSGPFAKPTRQNISNETKQSTLTNQETRKSTTRPLQEEPLHEEPLRDIESETTETETEEIYATRRRSSTKSSKYTSSLNEDETTQKRKTSTKPTNTLNSPFIVDHNSHSPTNRTKTTTINTSKLIQRTIEHNAPTTSTTNPTNKHSDTETFDTILEKPKQIKPTTPLPKRIPSVTTQSVAARRNIFETSNNNITKGMPTTPSKSPARTVPDGRRPSYMDHTKCSLEHMRRDSLEINKQNYTRKPSIDEDDSHVSRSPNTAVKFAEPQHTRKAPSVSEDIDIEEIWELEVLEKLLETVTSYELRRRIRAQIRLVKKNLLNEELRESKSTSSATTKKTKEYRTSSNITVQKSTAIYRSEEEIDSAIERIQETQSKPRQPDDHIYEETIDIEEQSTKEKQRDRSRSPTAKTISSSLKEVRRTSGPQTTTTTSATTESTSNKRFNRTEQADYTSEIRHSPVMERKHTSEVRTEQITTSRSQSPNASVTPRTVSPQRKPTTTTSTPGRSSVSPVGKTSTSTQPRERSRSPQQKTKQQQRQQQQSSFISTKTTSTRTTQSPERRTSSSKPKTETPIWADRNAILKKQGNTTPTPVRSSVMKTTPKTTMSTQRQKKTMENEDCITSSYGIGPTDENGLPLFGIRALKKKSQQQQQQQNQVAPTCETTEEVSGYVVEENFYSDGKTKPIKERKEYIYSTNADELEAMKKQVKTRKTLTSNDENIVREYKKVDKEFLQQDPKALLENEEFITSSSKNVRRGSVKEMSEKFIRKESSQSITEKSSSTYPKAGLILRTNSRLSSTDAADAMHTDDFSDAEDEIIEMQRSSCLVAESDSECESVNIRREVSESKSSRSSSTRAQSTRSFTNTSGETRIVTGMDDLLERMRNADNVVETGDTQEDQEARALLNKFLGASVIMHGVGSVLPKNETKTTTTRKFYNQGGDNLRQQEVKTTRVTKTIKSGSSSSPVTASTTCDIEEIWDEELLKELLEQAKTYEERRKIRARLRELMAEREAQKQSATSSTTEKTETKAKDGAVVTTTTKVTTRTVTGTAQAPKSVSPFAKFKQLDKQSSQPTPKSPSSPTTPGSGGSGTDSPTTASPSGNAPIFKFTDPALNARAATVKEQLLQWCQMKTQEYENIQITNFSTSWSDGLAFCALIHHFLPDAFDYNKLTPQSRRHNFELAFTVADEKAGIAPLLDVEDMVVMKRPDWKCVFVYVQSIYCRFRNCQ